MKRAPELAPLSREHHEALVLARRACEPGRADPALLREQVLRRWGEQFEPHFAAEALAEQLLDLAHIQRGLHAAAHATP